MAASQTARGAGLLAVARGERGVPNELYLLGSNSNYANEVVRPGGHGKQQFFHMDRAPVCVEGRGKPTWVLRDERARPGSAAEAIQSAQAALVAAESVQEASRPVHVHDLREVAERTTQALVEREAEVLLFKVLLEEAIPENPAEPVRTRMMQLRFHTADGTLSVFEPTIGNTGLFQGPFARRHVAFDPATGRAYGLADLRIGATLNIHARNFVVADADVRTRETLATKYGISLAPSMPEPPIVLATEGVSRGASSAGRNTVAFDMDKEEDPEHGFYRRAGDTKKQFLENGTAALRFEAEWLELSTAFPDVRRFAVNYYLADDTIEMLDRSSTYSSGGLFSTFLKRQRLPRLPVEAGKESSAPVGIAGAALPSIEYVSAFSSAARAKYTYSKGSNTRSKFTSPITGLPAFMPPPGGEGSPGAALGGPAFINGFCVTSSLATDPEFITAADLICGGLISVYGRPLLLKSCDPFTVAYGLHAFGYDQRRCFVSDDMIQMPKASTGAAVIASGGARPVSAAPPPPPTSAASGRLALPPHVGALALGGEEETRVNSRTLIPAYKHDRDFARYYQLGGKALRFEAIIDPERVDPEDARRKFVVSYFLEDDTLAIGEVTGNSPGHGPAVVRWLNRGKYRNASAPPDAAAAAVLSQAGVAGIPRPVLAAYDRIYGAARDKIGYTESSGAQGYSGGIYGKAERVGAGATGVESAADIGVRDAALHSLVPPPRHFAAEDFFEGARIVLDHMPGTVFVLGAPDGYTAQFITNREAAGATDPRDVFVPENTVPVPTLPLESVKEDATPAFSNEVTQACLVVAKILAGVLESARTSARQLDRAGRGFASRAAVKDVLASYGVQPPACSAGMVSVLLDAFQLQETLLGTDRVLVSAPAVAVSAPGGGSPGRTDSRRSSAAARVVTTPAAHRTAVSSIGTIDDPLAGPFLRDYAAPEFTGVPMVDYPALFDAIRVAGLRQQALQPRMDKLLSQLRTALLSSRAHLRKVFRDLDIRNEGVITMREFRHMLARHNLDVNISDAQLRMLMSRFPPAPADAAQDAEISISWEGFVRSLLDSHTCTASELQTFVDFVRGLKNSAPDGVGSTHVVPQLHTHSNSVSAWTPGGVDPTPLVNALDAGVKPATAALASIAQRTPAAHALPSAAAPAPPMVASRPSTAAPSSYTSGSGRVGGTSSHAASSRASSVVVAEPARPVTAPARETAHLVSARSAAIAEAAAATATTHRHLVNAIAALSATDEGRAVLDAARAAFAFRRFELYRALSLYDTARSKVLSLPSFISALTSAGLKLSRPQAAVVSRTLVAAARAQVPVEDATLRAGLTEHDVRVDYAAFFDALF